MYVLARLLTQLFAYPKPFRRSCRVPGRDSADEHESREKTDGKSDCVHGIYELARVGIGRIF